MAEEWIVVLRPQEGDSYTVVEGFSSRELAECAAKEMREGMRSYAAKAIQRKAAS